MANVENIAELVQACTERKNIYSMLASLYFAPLTVEQIEEMAQTDYRSFAMGNELLESGFNDITRYLRKRHTGTRQQLAVDYTGSFGGTTSYKGKQAVPFASVFLSENGLMNQEPRNQVYFAYRKELLGVANKSIPADHLSYELEFMGILSERMGKALEEGNTAKAQELCRASRGFLDEHILTWFPLLKETALHMIETRFYRGVLDATEGYLQLDLEILADIAAEIGNNVKEGIDD